MKKLTLVAAGIFLLSPYSFAQDHDDHDHIEHLTELEFVENLGQWHENAKFKVEINGGKVWLESDRFTYDVMNMDHIARMHEENHGEQPYGATSMIDGHVYQMNFVGSNATRFNSMATYDRYENFFLGNDESKWASHVPVHKGIEYGGLYEGINMMVYSWNGSLKYDYYVFEEGDPNDIRFSYEGDVEVTIDEGDLIITTSVGDMIEKAPFAYQKFPGGKVVEVPCNYVQYPDGTYGFEFPKGYKKDHWLIIDPTVIAATYSGTTSTVYGHTATYDDAGNIYSAGAGFSGGGYPTTTGAYQTSPAGSREHTITKYNDDGSAQIWATHLGGVGADYPHSMVVNSNNELYVLGSTQSTDFPTAGTPFSATNAGGTDITISALSFDGATLLYSTYLGGTGVDGQNSITDNYGDTYKGEIYVDPNDDVFIASMTQSTNFPTQNPIQAANAGGQDGVIVKLPADLSSLIFSSYIGTTGTDAVYSVVTDSNDDVYIAGAAGAAGLTTTAGAYATSFIGGSMDGYAMHLTSDGTSLLASSYIGTSARDQAFWVRVDKFDRVFINGQTQGSMTVTPGAYSGPSTGSFIQRFSADLTTLDITSTYGSMAPTAFLVDECNNIFVSGHGGLSMLSPSQFEASSGAFIAGGAGFYLMVLNPNASSLNFGTFYGNSGAHVDGGTSRFDPQGIVYQNCCSSGGSPTMTWAYATSAGAGWDSYVFKIDFEATGVVANATTPDLFACDDPPYDITFGGDPSGVNHFWDFGDGNTSTLQDPIHTYADTGVYDVMYVAIDSASCNVADTAYATITIEQAEEFSASWEIIPPGLCEDTLYVDAVFDGTGADSIIWDMGNGDVFLDTAVQYTYYIPGTYTMMMIAYDNVCNHVDTLSETFTLGEGVGSGVVAEPNVFSPNGDGHNDTFHLYYSDQPGVNPLDDFQSYSVKIYNRWGNLVYESDEARSSWEWDGKVNGNDPAEGVYYYMINYELVCGETVIEELTGHVTLMK